MQQSREKVYLMLLCIKGLTKMPEKEKNFVRCLKITKNKLVLLEYNSVNIGLLKSNTLCAWTVITQKDLMSTFKTKFSEIRLNNPKKGHICKQKYGFRQFSVFKKEFINRMYLRL